MPESAEISHKGTVKSIAGSTATVEIMVSSACATCKATSFCGSSESGSRVVEAQLMQGQEISVGDEVNVKMTQTMGTKAVLIGYALPFVVVMIGLFVLIGVGVNEGIAALVSLVLLTAYYVVLYLLRDRIKKVFNFRIEKSLSYDSAPSTSLSETQDETQENENNVKTQNFASQPKSQER